MFDGFSSLLKPENTSEFSPRFSVSFSRSRRNEFSPSSLQVASGENFWGFYEAIEKSRGNRKKLVVAMLWGDGGLRSAAVEIRGPSTQKTTRLSALSIGVALAIIQFLAYHKNSFSLQPLQSSLLQENFAKQAGVMEW